MTQDEAPIGRHAHHHLNTHHTILSDGRGHLFVIEAMYGSSEEGKY